MSTATTKATCGCAYTQVDADGACVQRGASCELGIKIDELAAQSSVLERYFVLPSTHKTNIALCEAARALREAYKAHVDESVEVRFGAVNEGKSAPGSLNDRVGKSLASASDVDFKLWMSRVDAELESTLGLDHTGFDDYGYRAAFDAGTDPDQAARDALAAAGYDPDELEFENDTCHWCGEPGGVPTVDLYGKTSIMHPKCSHEHAVSQTV